MKQSEMPVYNEGKSSFDKKMSHLLRTQIPFVENVFTSLPMGIEIYDTQGILRWMNERARCMYGVELSDVLDKVNLFDSPYVDKPLEASIKSGDVVVQEFEYDFDRVNEEYFSTRNKNTIIFEAKIIAIRDERGIIVGHMLLSNDVTATKEAEYRTEESKKNLEMAMDAANMTSWVYDIRKGVFFPLHGNPIVRKGMTFEELHVLLHPQDRMTVAELFARLIEGKVQQGQITVRAFHESEGQYRRYESRMRLSMEHRGKLQIVGTQLDVTEKYRMAKRTQDLQAKRELAMKVNNIVHWDFDVRTQKFEAYNDPINDYASDRLVTVEEYLEVVHPEDLSSINNVIQGMLSGEKVNINLTCRMQTKYDDS